MSAHRLYTPEVLAAAVSLVGYPLHADLGWRGQARSPSCGSRIEVGLALDGDGRIARVGLASHACAIGQASAAIFAQGAQGRSAASMEDALTAMQAWLGGYGSMPDWPGLELIAVAKNYPARHAAMLLAWDAAVKALRTVRV